MAETKKCENCDAVIGKDEKTCPACKLDLEALEENLSNLDILDKIRQKRVKAKKAEEERNNPQTPPKKKSMFRGLIRS
jgi:hypothetical protein